MTFYVVGVYGWAAFVLSWYAAYAWTSRAVTRQPLARRAQEFAFYFVSFGLLLTPRHTVHGLWRSPAAIDIGLLVLEFAGFAFAWWARIHLGRLWSSTIVLREGHRVVESGPYGLARHPIYTGFILAAWAFGLLVASPTALMGAAALTATMVWKARREEGFLRQELGAEAYDDYAARTPMLIPSFPSAHRR